MGASTAILLLITAFLSSVFSICSLLKGVDEILNEKEDSKTKPWKIYGALSGIFLFGTMFCLAVLIAK